MATPVLTFSQAEADEVYDELRELYVELDADPLVFGPKRLNKKVAKLRKMLDRCERLFLDVAQRLHAVKRRLLAANTELDLAKKHLFAEDPVTRAGRSVADRDAIASGQLKKEVGEVNTLGMVELSLESTLMVIKAKRTDLKDTQGRLRDQLKLCQEEIGLGNRWGSRSPGAANLKPMGGTVGDIQDIEDILGGVEGEINVAQQTGDWEEPEEMEQPEEAEEGEEPEAMPEPEAEPEVEPEPGLLSEPEAEEDLDQKLHPTSTTGEIDSFLEDDIVPEEDSSELNESVVADILSSFEKMDE